MAERAWPGLGRALIEREDRVLRRHVGHEVRISVARRFAVARPQRQTVDVGPLGKGGAGVAIRRR